MGSLRLSLLLLALSLFLSLFLCFSAKTRLRIAAWRSWLRDLARLRVSFIGSRERALRKRERIYIPKYVHTHTRA